MTNLELTPQLFAILSALIEERVGLSYASTDQALLASKLAGRASEAGFESLLDYYYFLRYDPNSESEFEALVNALVVNETFFFREFEPLQLAVTQFLLPLVHAGHTPRVWCAACSTGEEPLSLAMLLDQHGISSKVELVATDVSTAALERARAGRHGRRSLRHVPVPELAAKWLHLDDDGIRVVGDLGRTIDWRYVNLLDSTAVRALGGFDVILCRNVLIYFRDQLVSQVVQCLQERLRPGGALFVGVSESLMRFGAALECEERGGVFLYRKSQL
ncbi:MAG TPA: protein-glutamate O-methyltransferase CheR [Polyangiaceae bacterium]